MLGSLAVSFRLAGFPTNRPNLLLVVPAGLAFIGTFDTVRCLQPRWGFYHAGVILCLFMDMIAVCLILFFLLFPYVI